MLQMSLLSAAVTMVFMVGWGLPRLTALVCAVRRATMACALATRRTADDFLLMLNRAVK